ncbi:MAG: adenosylcobinamide-GDP ribazoletransferase [Pseudomonadota bacterium]
MEIPAENRPPWWPEFHDIAGAIALLSRLPVPVDHGRAGARGSALAWAFPLVGAIIGLLAGTAGWGFAALGVPSGLAAALALGMLVFTTGALHEDGLSDCADGLGGGRDAAARLDIMKDSRIGAFGAVALIVALLARWAGMASLLDAGHWAAFAAVGAISRMPMALMMFAMPLARPGGLAAGVGLARAHTAAGALALALLLGMIFAGWAGLAMGVGAMAAGLAMGVIAWRRIEGYTGDVLGATQQLAEVACLVAATLILL